MEFTQGVRFDTLGLSPELMRAIAQREIEVSTPVQAGCIPPMLEWKDIVAKAPTGTGKTFAYGIPIVEHIDPENEKVQAVIDIIRQYSRSRKQLMPTTSEAGIGFFPTMPVEVQVGGATIFVLDVNHFEKF